MWQNPAPHGSVYFERSNGRREMWKGNGRLRQAGILGNVAGLCALACGGLGSVVRVGLCVSERTGRVCANTSNCHFLNLLLLHAVGSHARAAPHSQLIPERSSIETTAVNAGVLMPASSTPHLCHLTELCDSLAPSLALPVSCLLSSLLSVPMLRSNHHSTAHSFV